MYRTSYQHRRQPRRVTPRRVLAVLVALVVVVAVLVGVQLVRGTPSASASVVLPSTLRVPGTAPSLPWPSQGAAAMEVEGVGDLGGVNTDKPLPLASITKLVTALVVLHDHPLKPGQSGPTLTVTAADAATYHADLKADDSVLDVAAGEHLTELQALQGMLIPSGDNVADIVADWDAGAQAAFVTKMNAEARSLGLDQLHLTDPSGLAASCTGTASDLLTLATDVLANPVLRTIVAMPQVTLPVAGLVYNYDSVLGTDGIFGIKTGSTTAAGGNFVFAATRKAAGHTVTVVGVVLGQQSTPILQQALDVSERLIVASTKDIRTATVLPAGEDAMAVHAPWAHAVSGKTANAVTMLTIPGETVEARVDMAPALTKGVKSLRSGERLGTVELRVAGNAIADPVLAAGRLSPPSLSYRLKRR